MSKSDIEANKAIVRNWVNAFNGRDIDSLAAVMHEDFVWNTAVQADDAPNELRPLQSNLLRGRNLAHRHPRLNRQETITSYTNLFNGLVGKLDSSQISQPASRSDNFMRLQILGITAEGDRVALEAQSSGLTHPRTGRHYQNFYHILFRIKDGKVMLLKEYQDTLHLFDFTSE